MASIISGFLPLPYQPTALNFSRPNIVLPGVQTKSYIADPQPTLVKMATALSPIARQPMSQPVKKQDIRTALHEITVLANKAKRTKQVHGPGIMKLLESFLTLSPESIAMPTLEEKAAQVWKDYWYARDVENIDEVLRLSHYLAQFEFISEVTYSREELLHMSYNRNETTEKDYHFIQRIVSELEDVENVTFHLMLCEQELVTVKIEGKEYLLRFKKSKLPIASLQAAFDNLPHIVPRSIIKKPPQLSKDSLIVLSEYVDIDWFTEPEVLFVVLSALQLFHTTNSFVPDMHHANFVATRQGQVMYVDQDILDYILTGKASQAWAGDDMQAKKAKFRLRLGDYLERQGV
jgi:hypothetical protein